MKFSIGDPVYVKSNQEEGIIEEFIGKDMASIRVGKSTYFVYLEDIEHPYLNWFTQSNQKKSSPKLFIDQVLAEKKVQRNSGLPQGVYLAFMPIYTLDYFEEKVEKIKLFLYNETSFEYQCSYSFIVKNDLLFSLDFELKPNYEFYIHDSFFEEIASNPHFSFRFIDIENAKHDQEFQLNIKPKKLFEYLDKVKFDNKAFFTIPIFEKLEPRAKKEVIVSEFNQTKIDFTTKNSHFDFQHSFQKNSHEIDLHIEKLISKSNELSPSEILYIQLKECQQALDLAHATHQKMLILIHGIGKGKLKSEIHSLLNQTKYIKSYVYEYDPKYGYGATKVFFKD
jgi:hypothetical protein